MNNIIQTLFIFFSLIISFNQTAYASAECSKYYRAETSNQPIDYFVLMQILLEPDGQPALGEVISSPEPRLDFNDVNKIDRSNAAWRVPPALQKILPVPWAKEYHKSSPVNPDKFYHDIYGKYENTFNEELVLDVLEANKSLEHTNTTYGEVHDAEGVVGTWRWFHANFVNANAAPYDLPFIRMNKARNVPPLKVTEKLKSFMELGFGVTEIGSFSVKSPDAKIRERTTHIIEAAWLRKSINDEVYVAHVASMAHARLYRKYGFEIAETYTSPGSTEQEAILWVRGWQLKAALSKVLNVHIFQATHHRAQKQFLLPSETRKD